MTAPIQQQLDAIRQQIHDLQNQPPYTGRSERRFEALIDKRLLNLERQARQAAVIFEVLSARVDGQAPKADDPEADKLYLRKLLLALRGYSPEAPTDPSAPSAQR